MKYLRVCVCVYITKLIHYLPLCQINTSTYFRNLPAYTHDLKNILTM